MIIGQTMFSVRKGTEHRSDRVLRELSSLQRQAPGHLGHRVLRSFGMSPLASALCDEGREAALGDVHFVFESEWESLDAHHPFFSTARVRRGYETLQSIQTSGPFEVLAEAVETSEASGVAY